MHPVSLQMVTIHSGFTFFVTPEQRFVILTACASDLLFGQIFAARSFFRTFLPIASESAIASFTFNAAIYFSFMLGAFAPGWLVLNMFAISL